MKKYFSILSLVLIAFFSCNEEEKTLLSSDNPAGDVVSIHTALEQGTKMYNDVIQKLYDDKGSVVSYEFPESLVKYTGGTYNYSDSINFTYAEEIYVEYLLNFYTKLISPWGKSWDNDFAPRNIFIVNNLKQGENEKTNVSNNIKLILAGAGEDKRDIFNKDTPYLSSTEIDELLDLTNSNVAKRDRIKFRSELFLAKFKNKIKSEEVEIPQEFKDLMNSRIDNFPTEEYNNVYGSLEHATPLEKYKDLVPYIGVIQTYKYNQFQNQVLRNHGFNFLSNFSASGTSSVHKFFKSNFNLGAEILYYHASQSNYDKGLKPVSINNVMVIGGILSEEEREKLIESEFNSYLSDLFKYGLEYVSGSTKIKGVTNTSETIIPAYPAGLVESQAYVNNAKLLEALNLILDKSVEFAGVDLRAFLSEKSLSVPGDSNHTEE